MTTTLAPNLTAVEVRRRTELESVVRSCIDGFAKAGDALAEIRDNRLYRDTHSTFEEYCQEQWGMGRAHAYRLIDAAGVAGNLSPIGDKPISESQARPLANLKPEEQREAWSEAVATAPKGKVTAKHVEKVVARRQGNVIKKSAPRGTFDDAATMLETFKQITDSLKAVEGLNPKKSHAVEVAGLARNLAERFERLAKRIEKGF